MEVLWFVQWGSFQPGSVEKLVGDLLEVFPERLLPIGMKEAGSLRGDRYSLAQCWQAWRDFENDFGRAVHHFRAELKWNPSARKPDVEKLSFAEWLPFHYDYELSPEKVADDAEVRKGVERFNWPFLHRLWLDTVRKRLPVLLRSLCVDKGFNWDDLLWYCDGLVEVLFAYMDHHAAQTRKRLAETEVVEKVFDAVEYAWAKKRLVRINGNSRFGKTESLKTYAAMYPGRVRLATVPCSNSLPDLIQDVAGPLDGDFLWHP